MLIWIAALPLLGALANLLIWPMLAGLMKTKVPRGLYLATAIGSVASACGIAIYLAVGVLYPLTKGAGFVPGLEQEVYQWISVGSLDIAFELRFDTLTALMVAIITFVGTLIHLYSAGYMSHDDRERTYFGYLNLFSGAMLILVLADNLLVMFIGWEGVGLCSYLLIGFWFDRTGQTTLGSGNADAGRKAFIVNRIGDFAFILGICLLFWATKTLNFHDLATDASVKETFSDNWIGDKRLAMFAGILLFIGACGKSAQIPLYVWLPDAMAGPTPVSALIHAATMVTAGVYMIVRLSFLFASSTDVMAIIAIVGALTALVAAFMAFAQTDLKKVLAYSTVSQLGFMFAAIGVGSFVAGMFHVMTHAFFKAGLFLGAGSVMHAMSNSGDIMKMGGLKKLLPLTHATFLIFCLAIAGFPLLAGFFSKDEILAAAWITNGTEGSGWLATSGGIPIFGKIIWGILTVAALGTAFYMFRLYSLVFLGTCRADEQTKKNIHESPWTMTAPLVVLAVLALGAGFLGMPHAFAPNYLESWLGHSIAHLDIGHLGTTKTIILMGVATAVGLTGMFAAIAIYRNGPSNAVERFTQGIGARVYDLSKNKLYVDEIYEKFIIAPFRATCRWTFEVIDRFIIDFIVVDGSAFIVDSVGRVLRWFQNGQVQRYMVALLVGGVFIFFWTNRGGVDFKYEQLPDGQIEFEADTGSGPGTAKATFEWDFNEDGIIDSTEPVPRHTYVQPGVHSVKLRMKDGAFGTWREVEKTIRVEPRNLFEKRAPKQETKQAPRQAPRQGGR